MISPRTARFVARAHKWLGLAVGLQLLVWTVSGLFFAVVPLADVHGEKLWRKPAGEVVDLSRVKVPVQEALAAVAEDAPRRAELRVLAGRPVWEIEAEIGTFLVSAEDAAVLSPVPEGLVREIAVAAWQGRGRLLSVELLDPAPRESGAAGRVWAARFEGQGHPVLYVRAANGAPGPVRTDLWRTYDFLWSLHIMDYRERENFNHPLIIAAAALALSVVLFGAALLAHRFLRQRAPAG